VVLPPAPPFDLRHLRYLVAVADTLSFTEAAVRLHVAPQAVSAAVRQLEERLGVALFTRTSRSVAPTPAGSELAERARGLLTDAASAADAARAAALAGPTRLRVGFLGHGAAELTTPILKALEASHPTVTIDLVRFDFTDVTAGLADASVDAAFLWLPVPHPAVRARPLFTEPRIVLLARDHPLAGRPEIGLDDLVDVPCIVARNSDHDEVLAAWSDFHSARVRPDGTTRPVGAAVRNAEEELEAVAAGRGARPVPASARAFFAHPGVTAVPAPTLPPATCAIAWRQDADGPAVRALVETAHTVAADR